MTATEIVKALKQAPFHPFELVTGDVGRYSVPTADHAAVSPSGRIAAIFHDDDSATHLDVFFGYGASLGTSAASQVEVGLIVPDELA